MSMRLAQSLPLTILMLAAPLTAQNLFINYSTSNGLVSDDNKSLVIDSAGVVWIGSKSGGATTYDGTAFIKYTQANSSLNDTPVRNIFIDSKQRIWFCQADNGVAVYDRTSWSGYNSANGLAGNSTFMAAETQDGSVYVSTQFGLGLLTNGIWSKYTAASGLAEDWVNYVYVDRSNNVWLGYKTKGVSRGNPLAGWKNLDWMPNSSATEIRVIKEDRQGNLWFGTRDRGAVRYNGNEWRVFTTADGLGHNSIWDMAVDSSGGMWFATYGGGLSCFNGKYWDTYTNVDAGIASDGWNWVNAVAVAADGSIWAATESGVSYLPRVNIRLAGPDCDINRDGRSNIADVMALLLIQRNHPGDARADRNGDGVISTADVVELLADIQSGACQ